MRAVFSAFACAIAIVALSLPTSASGDGASATVVVPQLSFTGSEKLAFESLDGAVIRAITIPPDLGLGRYAVASDGTVVFNNGNDGPLWVMSPGGSFFEVDASPNDFNPTITYNGSKVAFSRYDPATGGSDIYVVNADGTGLKLVASGEGVNRLASPAFSPDGGSIAYTCSPVHYGGTSCGPLMDGTYRSIGVMLMNTDGTNKRMIVESIGDLQDAPNTIAWSPDGKRLAMNGLISKYLGQNQWSAIEQLFVYPSDGSGLFWGLKGQVTNETDWQHNAVDFPSFSPDSSQILYQDWWNGGQPGPILIDRNGQNRQELHLTGGDGNPNAQWVQPAFVPPPVGGAPPPTVDATHIVVPSVHRLPYATAKRKLLRSHLSVGAIHRRYSGRVPRGDVIAQHPKAHLRVHRLSSLKPPVNLVVSRGRRP